MFKTRNEVCGTQNILRGKETERIPTYTPLEGDPVKPPCLPARLVPLIKLVVPHPQDVHLLGLAPQTRVKDLDSEDSQDPGILVWVDVSLRECHDVGVRPGIQGLRFAPTIVHCVIDSHRVVEVELVLEDDQLCTLFVGE